METALLRRGSGAASISIGAWCLLPMLAVLGCGGDVVHDASGGNGSPYGSGGASGGVSGRGGNGAVDGLAADASGQNVSADGAPVLLSDGGTLGTGEGGDGGASMSSGDAMTDAAGAGDSEPTTYPMLDAAQLGRPTSIQSSTRFTLAEGPLWDPCAHRLLFVDVSASIIYELTSNGTIGVVARNTSNANGLAWDVDGSLILAQMGGNPGHIARRKPDGTIQTIEPAGSRLHTPDDVIVRSDGTIYFSDGQFPPIGTVNLGPLPVYALKPGGSMLLNGGTVTGPNGVELSPDEKTLYVDSYFGGSVVKFAIADDGSLTKGAALATGLVNPDSLCLDAAGNLYVGVSTGLQVLRPDGSRVGLIPVPTTQGVTNCAFGGDDGKTLYITAWTALWEITGMPIPGLEWSVSRKRLHCM